MNLIIASLFFLGALSAQTNKPKPTTDTPFVSNKGGFETPISALNPCPESPTPPLPEAIKARYGYVSQTTTINGKNYLITCVDDMASRCWTVPVYGKNQWNPNQWYAFLYPQFPIGTADYSATWGLHKNPDAFRPLTERLAKNLEGISLSPLSLEPFFERLFVGITRRDCSPLPEKLHLYDMRTNQNPTEKTKQ